jgi:hypothetical protein
LLTELEEKRLQRFGNVKGVDRTRGTRRASELEFKGERSVGLPRVRQFNKALGDIKKRGESWQEIGNERLWEERRLETFC